MHIRTHSNVDTEMHLRTKFWKNNSVALICTDKCVKRVRSNMHLRILEAISIFHRGGKTP